MKKIGMLLLLQMLSFAVFASLPYQQFWQKGNGFYAAKNFDSAAFYYEKIAAAQPTNAVVYYNLGNAYYRLNQIGAAVLNYERALFYNPNYNQAKDNLALTQSRITNRIQPTQDIFFVQWWHQLTASTLAGVWSITALVFFLLFMLSIVAGRWGWQSLFLTRRFAFFAICLFLVAFALAYTAAQKSTVHNKGVVMVTDASLRGAKNDVKTIGLLPEGTTVTLDAAEGDWVKVTLPDGRSGWLRKNTISIV